MHTLVQAVVFGLVFLSSWTACAGPYSNGMDDPNNPYDPPIAGFVNAEGVADGQASGTSNPVFVAWATGYVNYDHSVQPGYSDGRFLDPIAALGPATGDNEVVSLGDLDSDMITAGNSPGSITMTFSVVIGNGPGPDIAGFENGFISNTSGLLFAELGHVEVSSDNVTFARFPSVSLTPGLVGGYGCIDTTNVFNLIGKHVSNYNDCWGTPFDLDDVASDENVVNGNIDLNNINYVRIVDIPGSGDYRDSLGNPIYDAWVTWGSGGVDLQAIGVLNTATAPLTATLASGAVTEGGHTMMRPIPFAVTFSEAVAHVEVGDIVVTNGAAANLGGSGNTWSFNVLPTTPGAVTVVIPGAVCQSTQYLGKQNQASAVFSFTYTAPPVVGQNGGLVNAYFPADAPSTDPLVSFDWDASGVLYYSTGDPSYSNRLSVWKYAGGTSSRIFGEIDYWAGARVTRVGSYIFFNESGDYSRFEDFNYYRYNPATGAAPVNLGNGETMTAWGLNTRTGHDLFVSAGGSSWSTGIYYTALDAEGNYLNTPWVNICQIGSPSGPVAFDAQGNMYYAHGYAFPAKIFRFSAEEVDAAIADPIGHAMTPVGHEWADLGSHPGATGMACDAVGNVILTATSFTAESELRLYYVDCNGENTGYSVIATYPNRLETVRCRDASAYVSCADGIFETPLPPFVSASAVSGAPSANAESIDLVVTFSETVNGVNADLSDFDLAATRSGESQESPSLIAGSLSSPDNIHWALRLDTGKFEGTVALNVKASGGIKDSDNMALPKRYDSCDSFTIDTVAPAAPVITAEPSYTPGHANTITWTPPTGAGTAFGAKSYRIACYTDEACTKEVVHEDLIENAHTFSDLTYGVSYWYRVQALDDAGNRSEWSSAVSSIQDDGAGPKATITIPGTAITSADIVVFSIVFDEAPTVFTADYVSLAAGSLAGHIVINGSGCLYTATVTLGNSTEDGTVSLNLAGGRVTDSAGNFGGGASSPLYTVHHWHGLTSDLSDTKCYSGDTHLFAVDGDFGPITPAFQWKWRDGAKAVHDGPNTASWLLANITLENQGEYWCEITYDGTPHESAHALLYVEAPLQITKPPADIRAVRGDSFTFSIDVSGGYRPLTYFWKFNGKTIADADGPSYTRGPLGGADSGVYTVEVLDAHTAVETASARLTVEQGVPAAGTTGLGLIALLLAALGMRVMAFPTSRRMR